MSVRYSKMIKLGTKITDFEAIDTRNNTVLKSQDFSIDKPVAIAFICNHCPYVKKIIKKLAYLGNKYSKKGFAFIAISSNDVTNFPEDSPEEMKKLAISEHFEFPYCYDKSQNIAKSYGVECTPDFYCFNKKGLLVYRGQFDSSRPGNSDLVTGKDLANAMDLILLDKERKISSQYPSSGCSIKWRSK